MAETPVNLNDLQQLVTDRQREIEALQARLNYLHQIPSRSAAVTTPQPRSSRRKMIGRLAGLMLAAGGAGLGLAATSRSAQAKITVNQSATIGQFITPKNKSLTVAPDANPGNKKVGLITGVENRNISAADFPTDDTGLFTAGANARGVYGRSNSGVGVYAVGSTGGLNTYSSTGISLHGKSTDGAGVRAISTNNTALYLKSSLGVPLHIKPGPAPAGPSQIGDMYVNTAGELFIRAKNNVFEEWRKVEVI